jgi:hypothetical protein
MSGHRSSSCLFGHSLCCTQFVLAPSAFLVRSSPFSSTHFVFPGAEFCSSLLIFFGIPRLAARFDLQAQLTLIFASIHAHLCSPLVWLLQLLLLISPHWSWLFHLVRQSPAWRCRLPRDCLFWWLRDACFIQAAVGRILILPVISDCRVSVEKAVGQRSRVSSLQRKNKPFDGVFHYSCVFSPKCHRKQNQTRPYPSSVSVAATVLACAFGRAAAEEIPPTSK